MSNHLTGLRGCGLVVATPQGRQMRYELIDRHLAHVLSDLLEVVVAVDPTKRFHTDVVSAVVSA